MSDQPKKTVNPVIVFLVWLIDVGEIILVSIISLAFVGISVSYLVHRHSPCNRSGEHQKPNHFRQWGIIGIATFVFVALFAANFSPLEGWVNVAFTWFTINIVIAASFSVFHYASWVKFRLPTWRSMIESEKLSNEEQLSL